MRWQMPIVPEDYDRSPLTDAERQALEHWGMQASLLAAP